MAAGNYMTVFDLGQPSLAAEFDCKVRLVARMPVEPLAVVGLGTSGPGFVIVDPSDFRGPLRMMFSGSLLMLTVVIFAGRRRCGYFFIAITARRFRRLSIRSTLSAMILVSEPDCRRAFALARVCRRGAGP